MYPGLGWCIFRNKECLPDSLVFHDNYLGIDQISFTLNFSKSAAPIVAQYYQFLRLGCACCCSTYDEPLSLSSTRA